MGHCIEPVLNSGQTWFKISDFGNLQNAASVHKKYKYKSIKQIQIQEQKYNVTQTFPVMHFDIWRIPHQLFDNHGDHGHDGNDIDDIHDHCNHKDLVDHDGDLMLKMVSACLFRNQAPFPRSPSGS